MVVSSWTAWSGLEYKILCKMCNKQVVEDKYHFMWMWKNMDVNEK